MNSHLTPTLTALLCACAAILPGTMKSSEYLVYEGTKGPGAGKHIVFIANDHEYRSEETCPALAKILAKHHGFRCTVLFGLDENGHIQAGSAPVPGMEVLKEADLLVFYTRFMTLPDEQADLLAAYFERGGPVVGLRTSTHCFNKQEGKWSKLNFNHDGDDYHGGLGEQIFGNTWNKEHGQSHYGANHRLGGTVKPLASAKDHPVLSGVQPFHTYSGAYKSQPPAGSTPLLDVQVLNTFGPSEDINTELPAVNAGWTRDDYIAPSGTKKAARVVYTSYGTSEDLFDDGARRFLVNACLWAAGLEKDISADLNVDFVGGFKPSPYTTGAFNRVGVKPADLAGWDTQIMPDDAKMNGLHDPAKGISSRMGRALKPRPELLKELKETYTEFDWEKFQP